MNCVRDTVNSQDCWTVLMSSRVNKTNCKFDIQHWKVKKQKGSQHHEINRKKNSRSCKKALRQVYTQFPHYFKKKLLLPDTQIVIAMMSDKPSHSPSVSVPPTSVLSSAYHPNSTTSTSSSVLPFKTSLISIFNWSFCLLWNAVNHHPCVSVKEQDSPAD